MYNLNLDIANERITRIGSNNWFEFDVMVSSNNSSLFFDNCLMRIQYSSAAFGSNVVAGSNVVITRAAAYNTTTYINPQSFAIDQASTVIGIPLGTANTPTLNRAALSTIPQLMLTIRMKILNCGNNVNINFTDQLTTSNLSLLAPAANTPITSTLVTGFNNTNYTGNITDNACEPIINSFTNFVAAGIKRTITIDGKYFGNIKGVGTVIFRNADKGSAYPLNSGVNSGGIQAYDVVSWNHNKIIIRLPSLIDSAYYNELVNNLPTPVGPLPITPGSGKFMVKNFTAYTKESSSGINIPYAIAQYAEPFPVYRKVNVKLASLNGTGYKIQLHPNLVTAFPNAKAVVRRVMKDWACATGVNWYLGADTAVATPLQDKISVINTGSFTALQKTHPDIRSCLSGTVNTYYLRSFDIEVKQVPSFGTWQVDTIGNLAANAYDFRAVMSHEFGHGLLVQHNNDSIGDIMWYAAYSVPYIQTLRKLVWVSFGALDGGNFVVDSLSGGLTCVGNHVMVNATGCAGYNIGIKNQQLVLTNLTVFPNPSLKNESIYIKFDLEHEENVNFHLFTITGGLIKSTATEKVKDINYEFTTDDLNPGIYLLQINVGNKRQTVKVIKE